jgi:predicted transcriptional regulator
MRIPQKTRDDLINLYRTKREAVDVWNEATKSIAEGLSVKPGTVRKKIKYEVEGGLDKAAQEMQLLLEL